MIFSWILLVNLMTHVLSSVMDVCPNGDFRTRVLGLLERQPSLPVCIGGFSLIKDRTICNRDASGAFRLANELDCKFPFKIKGVWHETCVSLGQSFNWCSVDKEFSGRYAVCEQSCPLLTRTLMRFSPGKTHSSCLKTNSQAKAFVPNEAEKKTIIDVHNLIRSKVSPSAIDMKVVEWDDDLARVAQRWAENCQFGHDCMDCRLLPNNPSISIGQNAYAVWGATYSSTFWTTALVALASEIRFYRYGHGSTTGNWENVGHYTQMIQAGTSRLGCGMAQCGNGMYAYCNYFFSQTPNSIKFPYTSGSTSCSQCTQGMCANNLCMCNKNCLNYGTLDQATCSCKCKPYATGNECEILLCDKSDKDYGCWGQEAKYCQYSNTKPNCPNLCGICKL